MMSQQEPNDEIENNEILENSADTETTAEPIDTLFSDESTDTSTTSAFTSLRDDMEEQILDSTPTEARTKFVEISKKEGPFILQKNL